jgi:hypothetical protein
MANAPSAISKAGQRRLLPFYCGVTESKPLTGAAVKHTHYVLIDEKKAFRMGIKAKSIVKPGGADSIQNGIVFQKNRKKSTGDKKPVEAKRHITQCQKSITVFCKGTVKNKKGKEVQETYSVGFPSNVPLRNIIEFFNKNAANVMRIGTGGNLYQVR